MPAISILQFRKEADRILRRVQRGESLILTYRGKPTARLEPILTELVNADDPIYTLSRLATDKGASLSNQEMDRVIYGE